MAQVLVRDLKPEVIERLKSRARRHGRSLQGEAKAILEAAATLSADEARQIADQWRHRLAGRMTSDSSEMTREDRDRIDSRSMRTWLSPRATPVPWSPRISASTTRFKGAALLSSG
jgi:plasmid stability protein